MSGTNLPRDWIKWAGGPAPDTGGIKIRVRLRCQTREDVRDQQPRDPTWWKRWMHNGGPGDIMEYQHAE